MGDQQHRAGQDPTHPHDPHRDEPHQYQTHPRRGRRRPGAVHVVRPGAGSGTGGTPCSRRSAGRRAWRVAAVLFAALLAGAGQLAAAPEVAGALPAGFVHRSGTRLLDGNGAQLTLKGVNVGGWLLWEGWIWGGGYDAESELMANLTGLVGSPRAQQFRTDVHNNFVTQADFNAIAALGYNAVRVPFNHSLLDDDSAPYTYKASGWAVLDNVVRWAEQANLYVVLDLHAAPCGQSTYFIHDPGPTTLWDSASCQDRTVALWRAIAQRYATRGAVAGYDLLNEPIPPSGAALVSMYQRIIAAIRQVDRNHLVIVEGADFAKDFSMFTGPLDANQAYSFHQYTWFGDNRRAELAGWTDVARRHDLPLWNGESGENTYGMLASTYDMYNADAMVSGWSFWTWKKVSSSSSYPHLTGLAPTANWSKLVKWMGDTFWNTRPTSAEAEAAMTEFLANARWASTSRDPMTVDALRTTLPPAPISGNGAGLTGRYYDNTNFTTLKATRTDRTVDFGWGWGSPVSGMNGDTFSVRWSGSVAARRSETHRICMTSDDGARVWVNNTLVIDHWASHAATERCGTVALTAGVRVPIRIDYYENGWDATARLRWESAREPSQIVPTSQLFAV